MTENAGDSQKETARKAREKRLATALRANLRRRKAGAHAAAESPKSTPTGPAGKPDGENK